MHDITEILGDTREGVEYPSGNDAIRAARLERLIKDVSEKLTEESAARVYDELAEHYRMAYSRHRASGVTEMVAHDRAMADLGKPRQLQRAYRWRLVTKREQRELRWLSDDLQRPPQIFVFLFRLAMYFVAFAVSPWFTASAIMSSLMGCLCAGMATATIYLPRQVYSHNYPTAALLIQELFRGLDFGLVICVQFRLLFGTPNYAEFEFILFSVFMFVSSLPRTLLLALKLRIRINSD
ncbi:MAG: hypothetical protein GC168_02700 [Candidatus Hydrogenedens sp.]|nr:hypothetical protein [Candidatus Hydrogenedens sp.]